MKNQRDEQRRIAALEKEIIELKNELENLSKCTSYDTKMLTASIRELRCYTESILSTVPRTSE